MPHAPKQHMSSRHYHAVVMVVVIGLGLASRRWPECFPGFIPDIMVTSLGDALWGLMIFLVWAIALPGLRPTRLALAALATCYLVEFSQLYHAPGIDAIRATTPGHLVLGQGFLWHDLLAYALGIRAVD